MQGAPRRPYQGGHEMGPLPGPMAGPAMVSYGYGPPVVYHPGYPIRGGFPGARGRGPPFMGGRGGFNGRGAYGGRGPYGGRGAYMGEGAMPERRPPPGTPGISSGFQARRWPHPADLCVSAALVWAGVVLILRGKAPPIKMGQLMLA